MRRVWRWGVLIFTVLIVVLPVFLALGTLQPRPSKVQEVGVCNGDPCFQDIQIGTTRWATLQARFKPPGSLMGTQNAIHVETAGEIVFFYPSNAQPINDLALTVGHVDVIYTAIDDDLTIGDVLRQMGSPCGINMDYANNIARVHYPSFIVNVILVNGSMIPASPIADMHFEDPSNLIAHKTEYCRQDYRPDSAPWLGFVSTTRYFLESRP
jgi:hypothetical protein